MSTVAITDFTFPTLEIEEAILAPLGHDVRSDQCRTPAALISLVAGADAVITQFAPVTADVIDAMDRARVIVRYGIGVDNVDLDAARRRGIPVCNVPDYCVDEVADHTLAFILAATRQVIPNALHVRAGRWGLAVPLERMRTLRDQVVGIVGFGRIGRAVARRAVAFGSRVLVADAWVDPADIRAAGCHGATFDEVLEQSDVLTLHCPSTPATRRMLNAESLARMKSGAIVVNLGRGDLVDTPALIDALRSGHVSTAALDVCDVEPMPADSPLRELVDVIASSHIASASPRAVRNLRETAARIAAAALAGQTLPNVVNGVAGAVT